MDQRNGPRGIRTPVQPGSGCCNEIAMAVQQLNSASIHLRAAGSGRITVPEIAERLGVGRLKVYEMLEQRILPGIRVGRQWIITRHAYEQWERTCGTQSGAGLNPQ